MAEPKPHDIRGTPSGHLPAYISRSRNTPAFAQTHPPVSARDPPDPGASTVLRRLGTPFPILLYYATGGGNIYQSTGQSWYNRLPGLPYFTGMRLVLSKTCHSTVRAFRPYSLTTQTGKLSTNHHSAALSGILIVLQKEREQSPTSRE